jgi:putative Mg2+ transporter-C (MgtC) family protein
MAPQAELEIGLRLVVALLLGGTIGLEREYHRHAAGIRTMAAVCMGSCLFTAVGIFPVHTDPTRVAAQVVTGVGFLGAGAILRSGSGVRGLTTAAAIWVVAAIGMAVGFGLYLLPSIATLLMLVFLAGIRPIERRLFSRPMHEGKDEEDVPGP